MIMAVKARINIRCCMDRRTHSGFCPSRMVFMVLFEFPIVLYDTTINAEQIKIKLCSG
jgi:hypothetical protein